MTGASWHATTIICVRDDQTVAMAGDGQVTYGDMVIKSNAVKIRRLYKNTVLAGFAGAAADAFALLEKFETKLEEFSGDLLRACVALAKDWRLDKNLRQLNAQLIVAGKKSTYVLSGDGNIIEPEEKVCAIGSGSGFALAAALGIIGTAPAMGAETVARQAMEIASRLCIYTNTHITLEKL